MSLLQKDFSQLKPRTLGPIHVFVAACFADLMPPTTFVRTLLRLAGGLSVRSRVRFEWEQPTATRGRLSPPAVASDSANLET